jgi:hypothetical protein
MGNSDPIQVNRLFDSHCLLQIYEFPKDRLINDANDFAFSYASAKGLPLGAEVSELLRQRADKAPEPPISASPRLKRTARGYLVKAKTGRIITPEMVKESSEDDPA